MLEPVYGFAGQIVLDELFITGSNGLSVDIKDLVLQIDLYEDIFTNTMNGTLMVVDSSGLIDKTPLIGEETVTITYHTPTVDRVVSKTFYVYKMTDRAFSKKTNSYILHLISREAILSVNTKLSKSFKGKISDSVKRAFGFLKLTTDLIIEETANSYKFISAYWTPLETINWIARRSINQRGVPNYLFYEDTDGFKFISVDSLMKKDPKLNLIFSDVNVETSQLEQEGTPDVITACSKVSEVHQEIGFDYMRRIQAGMYSSRLATYDMLAKNISFTKYDYLEDFNKDQHLDAYPMVNKKLIRRKIANLYFIEKNSRRYSDFDDQKYTSWFLQNQSFMEQLNAYKFIVEVPGSTLIKAGDVVKFTIPKFDEFAAGEAAEITDSYYTGKYLVTAVRHTINADQHKMYLEIIKDSFAREIK